jgi:L-arabinokinase
VIRSLRKLEPELTVHVRSTVPHWLFPQSVIHSRQVLDAGVVQSDCLEMDLDETLRICQSLHEQAPGLIEEELRFIETEKAGLIVGDIPPLCFEIAARAGIPSVAVANFTWDAIYRAYVNERPGFLPLIDAMERFYANATLALALPYPYGLTVFPHCESIPWISRLSALTKQEARVKFGLPKDATIVLLSFGGLGLRRLSLEELSESKEFFFLSTGDNEKRFGNLAILPDLQHKYQDLVRAADVLVSKPGYGIVTDSLTHRVPLLYTERPEFPEYPFLVQALKDLATAESIPQNELLAGNIVTYVKKLLNKDPNWPAVELNGARVAAEKILALLSTD